MTARTWWVDLGHMPPLSLNDRTHWRRKAADTRRWRSTAHYAVMESRIPRGLARVRPVLHCTPPDRRRRDVTNLVATYKAAIDGAIVDAGVVADDDPAHVDDTMPVLHPPDGTRRWSWVLAVVDLSAVPPVPRRAS